VLALDVEFLSGVCVAGRSPSDPVPDWPPQPDRLFSALVASWAARGQAADERDALEWLEQQAPPIVYASDGEARADRTCYVPPNDVSGRSLEALPAHRARHARRFSACVPKEALISYCWQEASPHIATLSLLQKVARDTPYLGHSSSLVRCFFRQSQRPAETRPVVRATRGVYPGRFSELEEAFRRRVRPRPGQTLGLHTKTELTTPASIFGSKWYVFADAGGLCPDLRATAVAARALRGLVLSAFGAKSVPEAISGHAPDGTPSNAPHMAIFPLADLGWDWSEGRLMGMAICLPREISPQDEEAFTNALRFILRLRKKSARYDEVVLPLGSDSAWRLTREVDPKRPSFNPTRYTRESNTWATATPVVLDRHPKRWLNSTWEAQVETVISEACRNIGLPAPRQVIPCVQSAIRGSEAASAPRLAPEWVRWAMPGALEGRPMTHATLVFDEPVQGPVALGAGRFYGLGLCLPLRRHDGALRGRA